MVVHREVKVLMGRIRYWSFIWSVAAWDHYPFVWEVLIFLAVRTAGFLHVYSRVIVYLWLLQNGVLVLCVCFFG